MFSSVLEVVLTNLILLIFFGGLLLSILLSYSVSAVLSQYIAKGLQRWGISTNSNIERTYVYLEWKLFAHIQKKYRPNDLSLKYCESEFTKHNHL